MGAEDRSLLAQRWDDEYRAGRYRADPPLPFVGRILDALEAHPRLRQGPGLYIGCGNGRNYLPLADAGLTLYGLDLSAEAVRQLASRRPDLAGRLIRDDVRDLGDDLRFAYVIAIQVFQHGTEADVETYFSRADRLVQPGGLFCLRVNSVATEIYHAHTVVERNGRGGFTIRYTAGPKRGLAVHFFSREELTVRMRHGYEIVGELREDVTLRTPPRSGGWSQWEGIWRKRVAGC